MIESAGANMGHPKYLPGLNMTVPLVIFVLIVAFILVTHCLLLQTIVRQMINRHNAGKQQLYDPEALHLGGVQGVHGPADEDDQNPPPPYTMRGQALSSDHLPLPDDEAIGEFPPCYEEVVGNRVVGPGQAL